MNPIPTKPTAWVALAVIGVHALLIAWALYAADRHDAPPGADPLVQRVQRVQLLPSVTAGKDRPAPNAALALKGKGLNPAPTKAALARPTPDLPLPSATSTSTVATMPAGSLASIANTTTTTTTPPAKQGAAAAVPAQGAVATAAGADKGQASALASGHAGASAGQVQLPDAFAKYLNNPTRPYPRASRQQQEQGRVMVRVWVSAEGLPQKVELAQSSGYERLDDAAQTAVAGWRFVPGRRNGQAEGMWVLVPVLFSLD
jgi:protein TonB